MEIYFKENISRIRRGKDITQERLGELCGVSRQAVTKWESGESLPDLYKLVEICDVLGVSIQELVFKNEDIKNNKKTTEINEIYELIKDKIETNQSSCLLEEYLQMQKQPNVTEQGQSLFMEGIRAIDMIETDKAYEFFEKALVRGVTNAGIELLRLFVDWYDSNEELDDKLELEVFIGRLMQEYGKIMVMENEKKYGIEGSKYIL